MAGQSQIGPVKLTFDLQSSNWTASLIEIETGRVVEKQTLPADSVDLQEWEQDFKTIPYANIVEVERFI